MVPSRMRTTLLNDCDDRLVNYIFSVEIPFAHPADLQSLTHGWQNYER